MHVALSMSDVIKTINKSEAWIIKVSCILHADRICEIMLKALQSGFTLKA